VGDPIHQIAIPLAERLLPPKALQLQIGECPPAFVGLMLAQELGLPEDADLGSIEVREYPHLGAQDLRIERLQQVVDRAVRVPPGGKVLSSAHRGEEDDRRLVRARALANQPGGLETVHLRHLDVHQDQRAVVV
jgi:hypothetical protein